MHLKAYLRMSISDDVHIDDSIYFYDESQDYCFSLWRNNNEAEIEIMVSDQLNEGVLDIDVVLENNILIANLGKELAHKLDDIELYSIEFDISPESRLQLVKVLQNIFRGKQGLIIR